MSRITDGFIAEVCSCIKYKGVHKDVEDELSLHIEELKENYIAEGLSDEEAEKKAVINMGNATEIGEKLNRQHKPQTEWSLVILTAIISIFGILVMYVSSGYENQPVSFSKHVFHIAVGIIALIGIYFTDYTKLKKHPGIIYLAGVLLLLYCMMFGVSINGVKSYLSVGWFSVSASALSAILFLIAFCGFTDKYHGEGFVGIVKLALWGVGSIILYVLQPSMSTALMILIAYAVVIVRAISVNHFEGNKKVQMISVLTCGGISLLSALIALLGSPYRMQRIIAFWNSGANDPQGSGWIFHMADKIRHSATLIGKGTPIAEGSIDWIMPEISTDFAFLNLINNFGWVVGIALIIFIAIYIVKMFIISNKVKNSFGFYLSLVSCVMLTVQFVISVLINLGLCPYIAVSLPFISYGGSNYLTNMIYVGMILSVWRKNNILPKTQRNVNLKEKMITFADNKLIIDFGSHKQKNI